MYIRVVNGDEGSKSERGQMDLEVPTDFWYMKPRAIRETMQSEPEPCLSVRFLYLWREVDVTDHAFLAPSLIVELCHFF